MEGAGVTVSILYGGGEAGVAVARETVGSAVERAGDARIPVGIGVDEVVPSLKIDPLDGEGVVAAAVPSISPPPNRPRRHFLRPRNLP